METNHSSDSNLVLSAKCKKKKKKVTHQENNKQHFKVEEKEMKQIPNSCFQSVSH